MSECESMCLSVCVCVSVCVFVVLSAEEASFVLFLAALGWWRSVGVGSGWVSS